MVVFDKAYNYYHQFAVWSASFITKNSGIIIEAMALEGNSYDGHTLLPQLDQVSDLMRKLSKLALVYRGYKGKKEILGVKIKMQESGKDNTEYEKTRDRTLFRRRAAVEPVIGHLKSDKRILRNYLEGVEGDMISTIMVTITFNFMKISLTPYTNNTTKQNILIPLF